MKSLRVLLTGMYQKLHNNSVAVIAIDWSSGAVYYAPVP